jgi:hypothetical protein
MGYVSRSSDLLCLEASRARVSQFCLKLAEERRLVVHAASLRRSRGSEAKDNRFDGIGCGVVKVGSNYPSLDAIFLLTHRGILVFCFHYK